MSKELEYPDFWAKIKAADDARGYDSDGKVRIMDPEDINAEKAALVRAAKGER